LSGLPDVTSTNLNILYLNRPLQRSRVAGRDVVHDAHVAGHSCPVVNMNAGLTTTRIRWSYEVVNLDTPIFTTHNKGVMRSSNLDTPLLTTHTRGSPGRGVVDDAHETGHLPEFSPEVEARDVHQGPRFVDRHPLPRLLS
jgi:hypothetical protein